MVARHELRRIPLVLCVVVTLLLTVPPHPAGAGVPYARRIITLSSGRIHSEAALGDLDGDNIADIVVGGFDGVVSAYRGNGTKLWSYDTGDAAIEGKAAIGDINQDGHNEVVVGVGSTFTPNSAGAIVALSHDGRILWRYASKDFNGDGVPEGVYSSPSLVDADGNDGGRLEIIYGSFDGYVRALHHNGTLLWELFTRDTVWSSPAVADLDRDGKLEVVIGSDSHLEPYFGTIDGGRLLVLNSEDGSAVRGFPISVDETIWSSPILVDLTGDGWLDIVVGTGNCWSVPACAVPYGNTHPVTKVLYAWDHTGKSLAGWPVSLPSFTMSSPSAADLDGDRQQEIVINTADGHVLVIRANGSTMAGWPRLVTTPAGVGTVVHFGTSASTVIADLTNDSVPEIIIPSNWEVVVFELNGDQLTRDWLPSTKWDLSTEYTITKTPAVGDIDGDGRLELIAGGARSGGSVGAIYVWDFAVSVGTSTIPWPYARLDALNAAVHMVAPMLATSISQEGMTVFHEFGAGNEAVAKLWLSSTTPDPIDWQLYVPQGVTASATSGTATATGTDISLRIETQGLAISSVPYEFGNLTVVAGYPSLDLAVANSPVSASLRVLVIERLYSTFIPLASK